MLDKETIEVLGLFPQPVFTAIYTDGNLNSTIKYLDSCELMDGGKANEYGFHSKNTYVLNEPECKPLADFIMQSLLYFGKEIANNSDLNKESSLLAKITIPSFNQKY